MVLIPPGGQQAKSESTQRQTHTGNCVRGLQHSTRVIHSVFLWRYRRGTRDRGFPAATRSNRAVTNPSAGALVLPLTRVRHPGDARMALGVIPPRVAASANDEDKYRQ